MKIKTAALPYEAVLALPRETRRKPKRPGIVLRTLVRLLAIGDLRATNFTCRKIGMERLAKDEPCLILMNHSSFIDLKIASVLLYPRPFNIVCTSDGFVGKSALMRSLGCIPTKKFLSDPKLVYDMLYAVRTLKSSVLMYPEASYSFDGTATPLPQSIGKCLKLLRVPVVMIRTYGAFTRDPLYNNLRLRRVDVRAEMEYLLSPDEIAGKTPAQLNALLEEQFSFDHFRWQEREQVRVTEPFRADGLNRVLYKCPACAAEGRMQSGGERLRCTACGKEYRMDELGRMQALTGETEFPHIPDWYRWQRQCVREELEQGSYRMEVNVDIYMLVDSKCVYRVGEGQLLHTTDGFHLTGCKGKLNYHQTPGASYSLYSDFFWYEMDDVICIGNHDALYYCFPKNAGDVVAKARLAAEELYRLTARQRKTDKET